MRKKDHPEWIIWRSMINQCYPKNRSTVYERNNIKVHKGWLGINGFWVFLSDVGKRPTQKHKLCRKDTSKDFTPDNCKWALNPGNRKDSLQLTYNNETKALSDWCKQLGLKYSTVYRRYKKDWTPEQILFKGNHRAITLTHRGKKYSFKDFCDKFNLRQDRTYWRLKARWDLEDIIQEPNQYLEPTRKHMNPFYGDEEKKHKKMKLNKLIKTGRYKQYMKYLQNI